MTSREYGNGICQRPEHRPTGGMPTLWEGQRGRESKEAAQARHLEAKLLCLRCPLLDACEAMVCHYEKLDQGIDGVVAGRYSTAERLYNKTYIVRCLGCGATLHPQCAQTRRNREGLRVHAGEQLCTDCYPRLSRAARKGHR